MHGFGKEKLAAVKAIKPVIENGEVISHVKNYNNTGVDRYIVAAKGLINNSEAVVGVVIKSYPKNNSNSKFYLHEAEIIKTGLPVMTAPQLSVYTVSKSVSDATVPQKAQSVNTSISENSENDTKNIAPVKNSLSKQGEQSTNGTPLKDLYYGDDIAPVKDVSKPNTQFTDNIAPITGEEANELQSERLNTLTDDDAPLKTETEMYK